MNNEVGHLYLQEQTGVIFDGEMRTESDQLSVTVINNGIYCSSSEK